MAKTAEGTGPANVAASNAVDTRHPDWEDRAEEWRLMRDAMRGSKAIKDAGITYLPMPPGFAEQADKGVQMYADYRKRAQFPDITSPTVMGMMGVIHRIEAQIEMPKAMEGLWEKATADGLPLEDFHRMITWELLSTGRYGILVDAPPEGADLPYLAGYTAETIINWSDDKDFYVLDETAYVREGFRWVERGKWRVLELIGNEGSGTKVYQQTLYDENKNRVEEPIVPNMRGGGTLDEIPFVVIGTMKVSTEINDPPLLGVANSAVAIYQLSADYRHQLYNSGQETLFCIGFERPTVVGSGVIVEVPPVSKDEHPPEVKYVSPTCEGIDSHKEAIQDERNAAAAAGARLFEERSVGNESGDARRIRYAAETATLTSISKTAAAGLEKALRYAARMMGLNEEEVVVKPNLSFVDVRLSPQDAMNLVKVWQSNAISYETLYENLQRGEIANEERTAEDELKLIDEEDLGEEEIDPTVAGMLDPNTGLPIRAQQTPPGNQQTPPGNQQTPPAPARVPAPTGE